MNFFQVIPNQVNDIMGKVSKQHQKTGDIMSQLKGYGPMVLGAWRGGDADEFVADLNRQILPAIAELMAAIAGVNVNLTKGLDIMSNADKQIKGLANGLGDVFGKIL